MREDRSSLQLGNHDNWSSLNAFQGSLLWGTMTKGRHDFSLGFCYKQLKFSSRKNIKQKKSQAKRRTTRNKRTDWDFNGSGRSFSKKRKTSGGCLLVHVFFLRRHSAHSKHTKVTLPSCVLYVYHVYHERFTSFPLTRKKDWTMISHVGNVQHTWYLMRASTSFLWLLWCVSFQFDQWLLDLVTLPETNSSSLKMDGGNTIVSFWDDLLGCPRKLGSMVRISGL